MSRSGSLLFSDVDGDVAMMSVETGKYYSLTAVGARIWALLERPASVGEVCDRLTIEYRVERTQCENDVLAVMQRMVDEGVVLVSAPQP